MPNSPESAPTAPERPSGVVSRVDHAVERAVEQERGAWVKRIEAHAAEIEAGLANDGHLLTSSERKTQRHIVITLRSLLPA